LPVVGALDQLVGRGSAGPRERTLILLKELLDSGMRQVREQGDVPDRVVFVGEVLGGLKQQHLSFLQLCFCLLLLLERPIERRPEFSLNLVVVLYGGVFGVVNEPESASWIRFRA
jgi:hypothetical protein